ncbi:hypothetical protein, partial [Anaerorhabdus sp.]
MKKILPILIAALASLAIVYLAPMIGFGDSQRSVEANQQVETSILPQAIIDVNKEPKEITKIYDNGKLLGVLHDSKSIEAMLDTVYKESYEKTFPNTNLDIGKDLYEVTELSYTNYENIDEKIIQYIKDKNTFTVEVNAI